MTNTIVIQHSKEEMLFVNGIYHTTFGLFLVMQSIFVRKEIGLGEITFGMSYRTLLDSDINIMSKIEKGQCTVIPSSARDELASSFIFDRLIKEIKPKDEVNYHMIGADYDTFVHWNKGSQTSFRYRGELQDAQNMFTGTTCVIDFGHIGQRPNKHKKGYTITKQGYRWQMHTAHKIIEMGALFGHYHRQIKHINYNKYTPDEIYSNLIVEPQLNPIDNVIEDVLNKIKFEEF